MEIHFLEKGIISTRNKQQLEVAMKLLSLIFTDANASLQVKLYKVTVELIYKATNTYSL